MLVVRMSRACAVILVQFLMVYSAMGMIKSELDKAIREGDATTATELLKNKEAVINGQLWGSALQNYVNNTFHASEVLKALIPKVSSLFLQIKVDQKNVLTHAINKNDVVMVKALLTHAGSNLPWDLVNSFFKWVEHYTLIDDEAWTLAVKQYMSNSTMFRALLEELIPKAIAKTLALKVNGNTILWYAVEKNDADMVSMLLSYKVIIDHDTWILAVTQYNDDPKKYAETFKRLIQKASPSLLMLKVSGKTVLEYALQKNDFDMTDGIVKRIKNTWSAWVLVNMGLSKKQFWVDADTWKSVIKRYEEDAEKYEKILLSLISQVSAQTLGSEVAGKTALAYAVEKGNLKITKSIVKELLIHKAAIDQSAWILAVGNYSKSKEKSVEILEELIPKVTDMILTKKVNGKTLLDYALEQGDAKMCALLVAHNVAIDSNAWTIAVINYKNDVKKCTEILERLIPKMATTTLAVPVDGKTVLEYAIEKSDARMVTLLLKYNAVINDNVWKLAVAGYKNDKKNASEILNELIPQATDLVLEAIVGELGENLHEVVLTALWKRALHLYQDKNPHASAIIMSLIPTATSAVLALYDAGKTALAHSVEKRDVKMITALLKNKHVIVDDDAWERALEDYSLQKPYAKDLLKMLIPKATEKTLSLEYGLCTILEWAVKQGDAEIVRILLENSKSVIDDDAWKEALELYRGKKSNGVEIFKMLASKAPSKTLELTYKGFTALWYALDQKDVDMVQRLIQQGSHSGSMKAAVDTLLNSEGNLSAMTHENESMNVLKNLLNSLKEKLAQLLQKVSVLKE